MQRGSFQWMKSLNKSIILNKIRKDGPISRAQIAKETKLTPPTVGTIVKELIEQGIIKESEQGTSKGGRKPTMLVINNSEFFIIGIDAGPKDILFVLSDLSGEVIEQVTTNIRLPISEHQFIRSLTDGVKDILERYYYIKSKVIGIGVAMHGVVDVASGTSLFAPNLKLRNMPIKQELEKEFELIVKVENDARAFALGEAWFGDSQETNSMMALNIGTGIGAGIIIEGNLHHGEHDLAGEIGHMTIDLNGEECQCGNNGCLQTIASGPAIVQQAKQKLISGSESQLTTMVDGDLDRLTGELIYKAALEKDRFAIQHLNETAIAIGIGLTNLIHIINPTRIVLGGGVSNAKEFILDSIIHTIKKRALTVQAKQTEVVVSTLGSNATVLGAVALILVELFSPDNSKNEAVS